MPSPGSRPTSSRHEKKLHIGIKYSHYSPPDQFESGTIFKLQSFKLIPILLSIFIHNLFFWSTNRSSPRELKDPIWHSSEWQIGSFSSEATRCRPKSGILPHNLNSKWMTNLIGWSRHVMDVSLVGDRLPYFVRDFSSTASCAKVSLNMWNTSAIFQVHIFLGLKRCFPAVQQMMTFILIADSVAISINIFPPGARRYYMPLKRVVYRTLWLRRDPILYVIGPGAGSLHASLIVASTGSLDPSKHKTFV